MIVFIGSGSGDEIRKCLSHAGVTDVLVYEPDGGRGEKLKTSLDSSKIHFISGTDFDHIKSDLISFFYNDQARFPKSLDAQIIALMTGEPKENFLRAYNAVLQERIADFAANEEDSFRGLLNTLKNYPEYFSLPALMDLKGIHDGKPGIVVGSGPSLTKSLPLLKKYQDHAIIFCTGSALQTLLKAGITPDYTGTLERDIGTSYAFEGMPELSDCYLVAAPVTMPETLNLYKGPTLQFHRDIGYENWVVEPHKKIAVGNSVSHLCYVGLRVLGCDPVILVGQDLCYDPTTGLSHHEEAHKYQTHVGDWLKQHGHNINIKSFEADGFEGCRQKTTDVWNGFRNIFAELIAREKGDVYNAIPPQYGIPIPLTTRLNPEEAFTRFCQKKVVKKSLEKERLASRKVDSSVAGTKERLLRARRNLAALSQTALAVKREISEFVLLNDITAPDRGYEKKFQDFMQKLENYQLQILNFDAGFFDSHIMPLISTSHVRIGYELAQSLHHEKDLISRTFRQLALIMEWYGLLHHWCSRAHELIEHLNKTKWKFW